MLIFYAEINHLLNHSPQPGRALCVLGAGELSPLWQEYPDGNHPRQFITQQKTGH